MEVDRKKKTLRIRATEISKSTCCARTLQLKTLRTEEIEERSPQMELGTNVHQAIASIIKTGDYQSEDPEVLRLLETPGCIIEGLPAEDGVDTIKEAIQTGIFDNFSLDVVEQEVDFQMIIGGWNVTISGTMDAMSSDGKLIVDWKTAASTPQIGVDFWNITYNIQLAIYANIVHKDILKKPASETIGLLVYIVKNKTPKLVFRAFRMGPEYIEYADLLTKKAVYYAIDFIEKGILYPPSVSQFCKNCWEREACLSYDNFVPQPMDAREIYFM